jgi:hypothetical protein
VYRSLQAARSAVERLRAQPRFLETPTGELSRSQRIDRELAPQWILEIERGQRDFEEWRATYCEAEMPEVRYDGHSPA